MSTKPHPSRALVLAPYVGIVISAAVYLGTGALFGADWPGLLTKVAYGIGMCVTATVTASLALPVLARCIDRKQTDR